jgi:hypothetical protein
MYAEVSFYGGDFCCCCIIFYKLSIIKQDGVLCQPYKAILIPFFPRIKLLMRSGKPRGALVLSDFGKSFF